MNNQEIIASTLEAILKYIGINPKVTVTVGADGVITAIIQGADLNFLIGFKGESLNALQSILTLITLKKTGTPVLVSLDINGYKAKKMEKIEEITKSYIDKVRFFEKEIIMPPMNPWERRQVHVLVAEYPDVESESTGEGLARRVVLKPKKR